MFDPSSTEIPGPQDDVDAAVAHVEVLPAWELGPLDREPTWLVCFVTTMGVDFGFVLRTADLSTVRRGLHRATVPAVASLGAAGARRRHPSRGPMRRTPAVVRADGEWIDAELDRRIGEVDTDGRPWALQLHLRHGIAVRFALSSAQLAALEAAVGRDC